MIFFQDHNQPRHLTGFVHYALQYLRLNAIKPKSQGRVRHVTEPRKLPLCQSA